MLLPLVPFFSTRLTNVPCYLASSKFTIIK
jgi:hypothetical protein